MSSFKSSRPRIRLSISKWQRSTGREFVIAFWEFAAFIANSLVFLLIGLRVAGMAFADVSWAIVPVATLLVLAGRAVTVYPLCLPFARSRSSGFRNQTLFASIRQPQTFRRSKPTRGGAHRRVPVVLPAGQSSPGLRGHRRFNTSRGLKAPSPTASVTRAGSPMGAPVLDEIGAPVLGVHDG
jgi:hypothetical protein